MGCSHENLSWDFIDVPQEAFRNITFKVKPTGLTSVENTVETRVMPTIYWEDDDWRGGHVQSNTVTTTFSDSVCATPVPEFPGMALPAVLIVGLFGAVLFIQKSKDN